MLSGWPGDFNSLPFILDAYTCPLKPLHVTILFVVLNYIAFAGLRFSVSLYAIHMHASPTVVGAIVALISFMPMAGSVAMGKLIDRKGMRAPLLVATMVLASCTVLAFLSESPAALLLVSLLTGGAYFTILNSSEQLVGRCGSTAERAGNYVTLSLCFGLANALSPVAAGLLIDHVGFPFNFAAMTVFPLLGTALILFNKLPNLAPLHKPASARVAETSASTSASGAAAGPAPRSVFDLIRNGNLRHLYTFAILFTVSWDLFMFMMPVYGAQLHIPASQIGVIVGSFAMATFAVRLLSRLVTQRVTAWQLLLLSLAGVGAGCLIIGFAKATVPLILCAFLLGCGHALVNPMLSTLLYEVSPPDRVAEAMGLRMSIAKACQIVLPVAAGAISSLYGVAPVFWLVAMIQLSAAFAARGQWHEKSKSA